MFLSRMFSNLLRPFLKPYEGRDYLTYQRARYLTFVGLGLLVTLPIAMAFVCFYLMPASLMLLTPFGLMFIYIGIMLWLLSRGHLSIAAHGMFIASIAVVWVTMFTDKAQGIIRLDSIVHLFPTIGMLPLLVQRRVSAIFAYYLLNFAIFMIFVLVALPYAGVTGEETHAYIFDVAIALIFMSVASMIVFRITHRFLELNQQDLEKLKAADRTITAQFVNLEETRKLLASIIDAMPSMIVSVDAGLKISRWNSTAVKFTDIATDSAIGTPLLNTCPAFCAFEEQIRQAVQHSKSSELKKRTFFTRLVDVSIYPINNNIFSGAVIRIDDVTHQSRLEELVVHSERMISIGGLAAGMAHEINNPLAGILHSMQVIEGRFDPSLDRNREAAAQAGISLENLQRYIELRKVRPLMDAISSSGQQAAKTVENMLSFSRKSQHRRVPSDIRRLIAETLSLAASDYDLLQNYDFRRIEIELDIPDNLPSIPCEPATIQQVIFNLLKNGAQAMHAANSPERKPKFTIRAELKEDCVAVTVSDNGPGMPSDIRKRVFDPFFTTKDPGLGTGLGLSVSYFIIVEDHGGTLSVESEPGKGASFTLTLPLHGSESPAFS